MNNMNINNHYSSTNRNNQNMLNTQHPSIVFIDNNKFRPKQKQETNNNEYRSSIGKAGQAIMGTSGGGTVQDPIRS